MVRKLSGGAFAASTLEIMSLAADRRRDARVRF